MNTIEFFQSTLICSDGQTIVANWFKPKQKNPLATIVVAPGAAAEARFYRGFCEYLANQNYRVVSFDFRSVGESKIVSGHNINECGFSTWIEHDYPTVIKYAKQSAPNIPLFIVGHSAGGWMSGINSASAYVDGILGVAALSAYWRHMARPHRYAHWLAWHVLVPIATKVFGFWPGRIGFRANMAKKFGTEFSRWARHPDFVFSDKKLQVRENSLNFRGSMHLLQIADDPWGTPSAVAGYAKQFPNASIRTIESIHPTAFQLSSIGHFGFFRTQNRDVLWPIAAARLSAML